jgi:signal transduction histidine kinase
VLFFCWHIDDMQNSERILLVDDDQNLLDACQRQMRKRFLLDTCCGPEAGLTAIDQGGRYAVVVSDMRMPSMDGVQFLTQVKNRLPDSVRLMLTGHPDMQTAVDAVNHGNIFRFLAKPCPPDLLAGAIEAALEQYRLVRSRTELLELKLRQSQQMELIGRCAAGVFHDLRNILTIINLQAGVALRHAAVPPSLTRSIEKILATADNAAKLTQQLLVLGRPHPHLECRPLSLGQFLPEFVEMLRHIYPKTIALGQSCPPNLDPIRADAGMLGQVLLNLALNARDAMPKGGTLALEAQPVILSPAQVSSQPGARPGRFVCLSIADSGCGMDTEIRTRLFQPFFTTKSDHGTGLGLAVVADIVQQHQGWLEVESIVGHGSTFRVFWPVWEEPATPTQTTAAA